MLIRTKLALHLSAQVVLVALVVGALLQLARAYQDLERAQWRRFEGQQLAAELHQSSDELSLMARLFVVAQNPRHAAYFHQIARMRDGVQPPPADHDPFYWDLQLAQDGKLAEATTDESLAVAAGLRERMRAAGFQADEMALLDEARQRSNALMRLEERAMGLVDTRGSGQALGDADWRRALALVHGPEYLKAKADVMRPIQQFSRLVQQRLDREREAAHQQVWLSAWAAAATLAVLALHALYSAWSFDRSVRQPMAVLRHWAQTVRSGRLDSRTRLPANTEFGELSAVIDEMTASVERNLADLREEVTRRTRAEEVVQHLANHDALTGLPSLRLLHDRLERALARAQRDGHQVAVLFVDLNGFKPINDRYGHESGDAVLKVVGQRLAGGVRDADTVGRVGGDEFLVILPDVASLAAAQQVRDKLTQLLAEPIYLPTPKTLAQVSAAIGIAMYPGAARDLSSLLRLADEDMYKVKAQMKAGRD